jgi:hypothetical protein
MKLFKFIRDRFHIKRDKDIFDFIDKEQCNNNRRFWLGGKGQARAHVDRSAERNKFMNDFKKKWHEEMAPDLGEYLALTTVKETEDGKLGFITLLDPLFLQSMSLESQAKTYSVLAGFWRMMAKEAKSGSQRTESKESMIQ